MFLKMAGTPANLLLAFACCYPLLALPIPRAFAQSTSPTQGPSQPFTHNKCDWLPGSTFSDGGYRDEILGISFKIPDGWRADPKLALFNSATPPPPPPSDPEAARKYDRLMAGKTCTLVSMIKNSSQAASSKYPRVEIDIDFYAEEENGVITAKEALDWVSALYKKNPALKTISDIHEVQLAGLKFLQLDTELLARDGYMHYFHRNLAGPAVNHLALTVRITATSSEDVGISTETLNSLQIDRTRFKLPAGQKSAGP